MHCDGKRGFVGGCSGIMVTDTVRPKENVEGKVILERRSKRPLKKQIRESITGWLFVLPMLFGICVFTLFPIIQSLYFSFYDYNLVSKLYFYSS